MRCDMESLYVYVNFIAARFSNLFVTGDFLIFKVNTRTMNRIDIQLSKVTFYDVRRDIPVMTSKMVLRHSFKLLKSDFLLLPVCYRNR